MGARTPRSLLNLVVLAVPLGALAFGAAATREPTAGEADELQVSAHRIEPAVEPSQMLRGVNPSVDHITPWISAVGASAAVGDLEGDALANDVCLVDPRSDSVSLVQVTITPSPRSEAKAVLVDADGIAQSADADPLSYDPATQAPMGCALADVDRDGWTDVLVYFWGRGPVVFLNHGDWVFEAAEALGPDGADLDWYTNTALFTDLNGDGHLDVFVGNYFANGSELLDESSTRTVAMNDSLSRATNGGANYVLLGRPGFPEAPYELVDDAFADDHSTGWTLAAATADLNGDATPDLYVANDFGPDRFFVNRSADGGLTLENVSGSKGLTDPRSTILGRDSFKGMGVTIADVDNDLDYDIYVSNITQPFGLFESQLLFRNQGVERGGVPRFQAAAEEGGLARTAFSWDNKVADLDNDGHVELLQATGFVRGDVNRWPEMQELALANDAATSNPSLWPDFTDADISGAAPRVVMKRTRDGTFTNVADASGLDDAGVMRGIAVADVDGDGDLDWIEANQWADARLIVNECDGCGDFVGLRLLQAVGTDDRPPTADGPQVLDGLHAHQDVGGTTAIGATATLRTADGTAVRSYVDGGNGHSGQSSSDIHFGIDDAAGDAHSVTLTWRGADGDVNSADVEVGPGWNTVVLP